MQGGSTSQPTSSSEIEQDSKKTDEPNTVGISKSDTIRYGQTGAEGGLAAGGADEPTAEGGAAEQRRQQGYGGEKDMGKDVGA